MMFLIAGREEIREISLPFMESIWNRLVTSTTAVEGRVELTTLTKEFFMPRFLERDEAVRREPWGVRAWDGVGEVRPFGAMEKTTIEGVY